MTDGIKIPVSADVGSFQSGTAQAGKSLEQLGKTAEKVAQKKINLIDEKALDASMRRLEKRFEQFFKRVEDGVKKVNSASGGGAAGAPSPSLPPPPALPAPQDRRPRRPVNRYRYTNSPEFSDVGHNLLSGFGGGFGQIASYGVRGARAGIRDAEASGGSGGLGGLGGLAKGLGIGALAFGAYKLAGAASEGVDMAKERANSLDVLKRQMGDLGVSFESLKVVSESAAQGMGINSKEAADLAQQFNKLSRGGESGLGLAESVRTGVGLSRAYGLDPSAGVGFLGGMRNIDPKQNNRELALMLAEAINKSGMSARADELMQAIQSYAAMTSRMSLSSPNVSAYAGAYAGLMGSGYAGMTPDVAAGILSQANSAVMSMGGAGEAGQNFILQAMQRQGAIDPIAARALAEGGMFGTRRSVFGGGPLAKYFGGLTGGSGADVTTIDSIKAYLDRQGMSPELKLDAFKNLMHLSSYSNAAALMDMQSPTLGRLSGMMSKYGVDPNSLNPEGLQGLARIADASGKGELSSIADMYMRRTGKGALNDDEKRTLESAKGMDEESLRGALIKIAASKDQEQTDATRMRDSLKSIENAQITVGDKLLVPLMAMKDLLGYMAGGGKKSQKQIMTDIANLEYEDGAGPLKKRKAEVEARIADSQNRLSNMDFNKKHPFGGLFAPDPEFYKGVQDKLAADQSELSGINGQLDKLDAERQQRLAPVMTDSSKWRAYQGQGNTLFDALIRAESGGRHYAKDGSLLSSNKGALGITQVMPKTGADPGYGVTPLRNQTEEEYRRFGQDYLSAMLSEFGGDQRKALAAYNAGPGAVQDAVRNGGSGWLDRLPKETQNYVSSIMQDAMGSASQIPTSAPASAGGTGETTHVVRNEIVLKSSDGKTSTISNDVVIAVPRGAGTKR
jgi:hypothetical protein